MVTDPLFYRLFVAAPETFFLLLGMPVAAAFDMASRYQFESLEFKETSHRLDGIFQPKDDGLPLYFLEVQFYHLPNVFAGLLAKAFTYLKFHDPAQPFVAVVLFGERAMEPAQLAPYQPSIDAGVIRRFYFDELPELANAPLGLSILYLIRQTESESADVARKLIDRTKEEIDDESLRANLLDLIETVIIYKLPRLSREEIQAMLQVHDIRETRVYKEAKEEGKEEERAELQRRVIAKLAAKKMAADEIADVLGLDGDFVRNEMAN